METEIARGRGGRGCGGWRGRKGEGKDGQSRRHFESEGIYDRVLGVYRVAEAVTEGFASN